MKSKKGKLSKEILIDLIDQKLTKYQIAEILEITPEKLMYWITIHKIITFAGFHSTGLPHKSSAKKPLPIEILNERKDKLLTFIIYGCKKHDIAEYFNVSTITISNWMKSFNIKPPRGFTSKGLKIGRPKGIKSPSTSGPNNPRFGKPGTFLGKKHSEETKILMKENHADFTGDKNPFRKSLEIEGKRDEHKARTQAIWDTRDEVYRKAFGEKLSESHTVNPPNGSGRNYIHGTHITQKVESGNIWYRSSWELAFAIKLDNCDRLIKYEFEKIRVPFYRNGSKRYTYFDFHLFLENGNEAIIEVKPDPIALIKQEILIEQANWCIDNQKQYAIINKDIIDNYFDELINSLMNGKLDARTFIGQRAITSAITLDTIKC